MTPNHAPKLWWYLLFAVFAVVCHFVALIDTELPRRFGRPMLNPELRTTKPPFLDGRITKQSFLTQKGFAICAPRITSPEIERLRDQLARLEVALRDLQTRYTEDHPRIRIVKDRIDEITHELRQLLCPFERPPLRPPVRPEVEQI